MIQKVQDLSRLHQKMEMQHIVDEDGNIGNYRDIDLSYMIRCFCSNIEHHSMYDIHGQIQLVRRYDQKVMVDENIGQGLKGDKYLEIYGHLHTRQKGTPGSALTSTLSVQGQQTEKQEDAYGRTNKHQALGDGLTDKIAELHGKGMSNVAIGKELGISRNTVYNRLKKLGTGK